jgi:hypothetical protein
LLRCDEATSGTMLSPATMPFPSVRVEAMKKRSRAGGKPAKARPRKALKLKGRKESKAVPRRGSAPAGQETQVAQLTRERDEALEQQAALSDVLRVISNSPGDVQPVLDSVAKHAAHICEAHVVDLFIVDNETFRIAGSFGELGGRPMARVRWLSVARSSHFSRSCRHA